MSGEARSSGVAGGVFIAIGAIGGAAGGLMAGQPSIGFLLGTGLGLAIAALIWWRMR
ncbi:MAG: hypothetical protein H7X93_12840 [Sphingomonadaceae bacterium]|nr:hypothetical protein [Sphingomonadaceae bacterium]